MPRYDVMKDGRLVQVTMSFAEYDQAVEDGMQFVLRPDGAPVAIFNGAGFTRRSTHPKANQNIDHRDWRSSESWPGPPEKERKRGKGVTNWTADQFRKGAV
jgi:hypothetical protein